VLVNLNSLDDRVYVEKTRKRLADLEKEASHLDEQARKIIMERLA
jgi:formiminotetrahydrofolate cyclodeaminase